MFDFHLLETFKYYLLNILLISIGSPLWRGDYEVSFQKHALQQVAKRDVPWDLVKKTIFEGKFQRFGNDKVRIWKRFNRGTIICIGVFEQDNRIRVITVELGR